jgi:methyl-accepting chemotaxis protein
MALSIGQKLGAVVGLLVLLAVSLSAFAFWQSVVQRRQTAEIETTWNFALQARTLSQSVEHVAVVANSLFASDTKEDVRANLVVLSKSLDQLKAAAESFLSQAGPGLPEDKKTRLALDMKDYVSYQNDLVQLGLTVSPKAALIQANDDSVVKNRAQMISAMETLTQQALDRLSVERDAYAAARQRNDALMIGGAVAGILIGVLAATWIVATQIRRPLETIISTMRQVAEGQLDADIPFVSKRDEVGDIARAVQVFKQNAVERARLEAEAVANRAGTEAEREWAAAERAKAAEEQAEVVRRLGGGLKDLASGDLMIRLGEGFSPSYAQIRDDFNEAIDKLKSTILSVVESAGAIKAGAQEISAASDDLSRRTGQQAARLEQTAATLGEVTATVKKSAEGASHARQVVTSADADAKKSAGVVRQAVDAMSTIAKSSQQISQIIGVIDEIAFQTNLLALNAGVEAARAGEAGRGFAVVASEVRALAQRSAEAAKEIKALISNSVGQVDVGVKLVAETGRSLERIMTQVTEINAVVGDIAAGAQEQSTALQEINDTIEQMNLMMQQDAAMVEESTAAGHSLSEESSKLANLVGQFQVGRPTSEEALRRKLKEAVPHAFQAPGKTARAALSSTAARLTPAERQAPTRSKVASAALAGDATEF